MFRDLDGAPGQRAQREHQRTRDQETAGTHPRRGNMLDGDLDSAIGRAPEDVDESKAQSYTKLLLFLGCCHGGLSDNIRVVAKIFDSKCLPCGRKFSLTVSARERTL